MSDTQDIWYVTLQKGWEPQVKNHCLKRGNQGRAGAIDSSIVKSIWYSWEDQSWVPSTYSMASLDHLQLQLQRIPHRRLSPPTAALTCATSPTDICMYITEREHEILKGKRTNQAWIIALGSDPGAGCQAPQDDGSEQRETAFTEQQKDHSEVTQDRSHSLHKERWLNPCGKRRIVQ